MIQFKPNVQAQSIIESYRSENEATPAFQLTEVLSDELNIHTIVIHQNQGMESSLYEHLKSDINVLAIQKNHTDIELRTEPNDPSFAGQWHLKNINASQAWDIAKGGKTAKGDEIVVAILDESFEISHNDLKNNFWKNKHDSIDGVDNDHNGFTDDFDGWNFYRDTNWISSSSGGTNRVHGTMVAGVAGATTNNNSGVASVGWGIKVLPVMASGTNESFVVKGLQYVLKMRKLYNRTDGDSGAYIVACNMSFGVNEGSPADYPIWCNLLEELGKAGVLSVGAGPNSNTNVDMLGDIPTTCPSDYLISVTRSNNKDEITGGGYGKINMDVVAPGWDILTTALNSQTGSNHGSSFSAPQATGAIALMYSALPSEVFDTYKDNPSGLAFLVRYYLLQNGVRKLDHLTDKLSSGGALDVGAAVKIASQGPPLYLSDVSQSNHQIKLFPNPIHGEDVMVNATFNLDETNFHVWDLTGKEILNGKLHQGSNNQASIDIRQLNSGMYVFEVTSEVFGAQRQLIQKL